MFVPMKRILDAAYEGKYGVPAVPGFQELQVRAAIGAAEAARSPLILLTGNFADAALTNRFARTLAERAAVGIALCLDHSPTFEDCVLGIRNGVTAIMADRSKLPYPENAAQVAELTRVARAAGVSVEAELGHVGWGENYAVDGKIALTDPGSARRFFEETGIDALAVAVGTAHGTYSGEPKLDFQRLREINAACGKPLVLHGGSGSGEENIRRACELGIAKVNVVTDVLNAAYRAALEGDFHGNACHRFFPAISAAIERCVVHLCEVTGSAGRAEAPGEVGREGGISVEER